MTKQQFKALPPGRKAVYLVGHYFWHVLLAFCLIVVVGTWIYQEFVDRDLIMGVEMINVCSDSSQEDAFAPFMEQSGYDMQKEKVRVSKVFKMGKNGETLQCDPHILLFCRLNEEKTDLFFWDDQELEWDLRSRGLADLRQYLPAETLKKYEDQLIYSKMRVQGGYPCGIRLEDNSWIQENHYYDSCSVGIARNAKHTDAAVSFLAYILK